MHRKNQLLIAILSLFISFCSQAQNQTPELLFIIKSNGDTLATSKIFKNKSNEDWVVFVLDGKRKTLTANEVKSYYQKGRKVSINVATEKQKKLVNVKVRGRVRLAQSMTPKGKEKFYLYANEQWISLEPNASNLKAYLSELLPDFNEAVKDNKIHYDTPSLGTAITQYNEFKEPSLKMIGTFKYTERFNIGFYGSVGLNTINISEFPSDVKEMALSTSFGLGVRHQYNRYTSLRVFLGFAFSSWDKNNLEVKLRTLNLNPLLDIQLYESPNNMTVSAAAGFNFNFDVASKIAAPSVNDKVVGLGKLGVGYDFQLHCTFDEQTNLFISYQIMNNQRSGSFETFNNQFIEFKTNEFRLGALFYF